MKGRIVKIISSSYFVETKNGSVCCSARKTVKNELKLVVGDLVEVSDSENVIEKVYERKNSLIRPYVANVDICAIVIALKPSPDFLLVDKILVNCLEQCIEPVLVVNKCDLEKIDMSDYSDFKIFYISALTGDGVDDFKNYLSTKTVCLAGQSAVGKSSLINAMLGQKLLETGDFSKKIERGKNTTRQTSLLKCDDFYIIDTCGFSLLNVIDIPPENLRLYYDEFLKFSDGCRFTVCTHTDEPDCAIKERVGKDISKNRYDRYVAIFNELSENRRKKYE